MVVPILSAAPPLLMSDLLEELLQRCRVDLGPIRAAIADPSLAGQIDVHSALIGQCVEALDDDELHAPELAQLRAVTSAAAGALPESVVARLLAMSLDSAHADAITQQVQRDRGPDYVITPRVLVPIQPIDRSTFGDLRLSANPNTTDPPIDRTSRFTLAPDDMRGVNVTLSWGLDGALAATAMRPDLRVAVACPTPVGMPDLALQRYTRQGRHFFYDVRPARPLEIQADVLLLLNLARDAGAHIAVLPELLVDDALLAVIRAWLVVGQPPHSVIAGSRHTERADASAPGRNIATLVTAAGAFVEHDKYAAFAFPDHDGTERHEDIAPMKQVRVLAVGRASMLMLVCKDYLDPDVAHVATHLRVGLVVVPSLTNQSGEFRARAGQLALEAQTTSIVTNGLRAPPADAVIVVRPTRVDGMGPSQFLAQHEGRRVLAIVTLGQTLIDVIRP